MDLEQDPYKTLGLEGGASTTEAEIKKAYRKKALASHPDRRKDVEKKQAEEEFDCIQKAYELLMDPEGRKAFDDLIEIRKARRAKLDQQDAKRRKLREDLEARERESAVIDLEKQARDKLKAELERIQRESFQQKQQARNVSTPGSQRPDTGSSASAQAAPSVDAARTLKVTWSTVAGAYSAQQIKEIFKEFGAVEDVVIRDSKKKKGTALIIMATTEAAIKAAAVPVGDYSNPLEVKRMGGDSAGTADRSDGKAPSASASASRATPGGAEEGSRASGMPTFGVGPSGAGTGKAAFGVGGGPVFGADPLPSFGKAAVIGSANKDYESVTLMRMRQAAERARLIKEMEEEDAREGK